jgi:hypothetical protein
MLPAPGPIVPTVVQFPPVWWRPRPAPGKERREETFPARDKLYRPGRPAVRLGGGVGGQLKRVPVGAPKGPQGSGPQMDRGHVTGHVTRTALTGVTGHWHVTSPVV